MPSPIRPVPRYSYSFEPGAICAAAYCCVLKEAGAEKDADLFLDRTVINIIMEGLRFKVKLCH